MELPGWRQLRCLEEKMRMHLVVPESCWKLVAVPRCWLLQLHWMEADEAQSIQEAVHLSQVVAVLLSLPQAVVNLLQAAVEMYFLL